MGIVWVFIKDGEISIIFNIEIFRDKGRVNNFNRFISGKILKIVGGNIVKGVIFFEGVG